MTIQIYNTLTRKKEEFIPLEEGKVKMYVCGPTVYNYIHIGNARPAIVFDTVRRYLEFRGYDVHYISNFTDVDDKLIRVANEVGEDVPTIANRFIEAYFEDVTALGCKKADVHPRVTENMDNIIEFIRILIEKGFAYESEGDVYFHTRGLKVMESFHSNQLMSYVLVPVLLLERRSRMLLISLFGKMRKKEKFIGKVHGEKEDLVGILSVQQWRRNTWVKQSIFMQVVRI